MGIGVDLISIKRFKKLKKNDYQYWSRVFSKKEWGLAFRDKNFSQHLAGMFVAKEAAMKATGKVGVKNFRFFEISYRKQGEPKINKKGLYISISHAEGLAVAVVIKMKN
ncbi:MAG: hypothetical protein A3I24_02850 [Candidatus Harrisonbacteria bacterium RIFCSPLOWO2_02_FULL_41_13b]|uniref:Holo-[acyl-carrier-protein] synthase n=1 Tax=Candidatus Harrisonbacteria bacterium RIFCSPLOWO2_02_FULL_41_13b TaxID=1798409 RepID=A0A1G1ZQX1_9BACT|nr:MAG: hypothetical protein A3J53_01880 [Candidatus Harrisonbacteria bacterium RIFCSPHIGHO2_02_FULL_40_20]OGY67093.1 MAG: hypothetical protein A3I24_02850 [Candidatus Harrisonbacteria bacterium RIFCSPLOWO2_02_FULL_41_13b]